MRIMSVDLGKARIGIAVGDSDTKVGSPRPVLRGLGSLQKDAEQVFRLGESEEVEAFVVGVPKGLEDSGQQRICERFAGILRELGALVYEVDESMTSLEAESLLIETGMKASGRRRLVDSGAARIILERFFEEHA